MALSGGFRVVVMGKGHDVTPRSGYLGRQSLREVLFLGCQGEGNVPEETPRVQCLIPSSLSLCPHGEISASGKPLCWGSTSSIGGGDSQEGGWRWEPSTRTWGGETRWLYEALPAQEDPQVFGCPGLLVAFCGPAWLWRLWSHQEGSGQYRSKGSHLLAHPPSDPWESSHQMQACSGPRDVTPAQLTVAWRGLTSYFCLGLCVPGNLRHFHKWIPLFPGDPVYGLFIPEVVVFFFVIAGVPSEGLAEGACWWSFSPGSCSSPENCSSPERLADFLFLFSVFRPQWTTWRMRRPARSATCSLTRATRSCSRTWCTISTTGTSGRWRTSISSPGRWAPAPRPSRFRSRLYPTSGRPLGIWREGLFQKRGNLSLLLALFCLLTLYPFVLFSKSANSPEMSSITETFPLGIDTASWFYVFSVSCCGKAVCLPYMQHLILYFYKNGILHTVLQLALCFLRISSWMPPLLLSYHIYIFFFRY